MDGFLGTGASFFSDLSLLAYILLIVPGIIVSTILARRGLHRPHHQWSMVGITALNWVLILFLMAGSYLDVVRFTQPGMPDFLVPTIHAGFGLPAQLLATFIVIRMWKEDRDVARANERGELDTRKYWFKRAKPLMRLTLILWLVTSTFGIITYVVRYDVLPPGESTAPPAVTTEEAPATTEEAP